MQLKSKVTGDLGRILELEKVSDPNSKELMSWKKSSAMKYRSFLYKRFDRFSRGGGNWRKTKAMKRSKKKKFILRISHTLFKALSAVFRKLPGQFEEFKEGKVLTGIGGPGKHPNANMKVGRLAAIHHHGEGYQTQRKIVVRPDSELKKVLVQDLRSKLKSRA